MRRKLNLFLKLYRFLLAFVMRMCFATTDLRSFATSKLERGAKPYILMCSELTEDIWRFLLSLQDYYLRKVDAPSVHESILADDT